MTDNKIKLLNLILVRQGSRILLGMKKRGFGAGRYNGFGGKVHEGETVSEGAKRELQEEAGIISDELKEVGILDFIFQSKPEETLRVYVFEINNFKGEPVEGEEMKPEWFDVDNIPFEKMWPDDKYWFPLFIEGKKFNGRFVFGAGDEIIEHTLEEVE